MFYKLAIPFSASGHDVYSELLAFLKNKFVINNHNLSQHKFILHAKSRAEIARCGSGREWNTRPDQGPCGQVKNPQDGVVEIWPRGRAQKDARDRILETMTLDLACGSTCCLFLTQVFRKRQNDIIACNNYHTFREYGPRPGPDLGHDEISTRDVCNTESNFSKQGLDGVAIRSPIGSSSGPTLSGPLSRSGPDHTKPIRARSVTGEIYGDFYPGMYSRRVQKFEDIARYFWKFLPLYIFHRISFNSFAFIWVSLKPH